MRRPSAIVRSPSVSSTTHFIQHNAQRLPRPSDSELESARAVLAAEMETLASEAGDATAQQEVLQRYSQLLSTMSDDVLYVPSKSRYGRASLHSQQDAIVAAEHEHTQLRDHMGHGLKKALKLEKKLTIVLGGYSVRFTLDYGVGSWWRSQEERRRDRRDGVKKRDTSGDRRVKE